MAYGEPDSGLPPRGPGPSQHIDHAWKRAATRRSGAPAGIGPESQPLDVVGVSASDDLADGHGNLDAERHGGSCLPVSDDGRGGGISPRLRHDGGRSAEQLGSVRPYASRSSASTMAGPSRRLTPARLWPAYASTLLV